jgi:hypothetical protein
MESYFIAIGFYKNSRRYISIDTFGRIVVVEDIAKAAQMSRENAAVAALVAGLKFNLAHCRAVSTDEAQNAEPI